VPGAQQIAALKAAAPSLVQEQLVKPGTDLPQVIDALVDSQVAQPVVTAAQGQ
jgi:sulfonate transport system substrate-binding protein